MKKSRDASELAARIAAAANKPAGAGSLPSSVAAPSAPTIVGKSEAAQPPRPSKAKAAKPKPPETVPITLRPSNDLLNRYVLRASERTREEGRVVSAQQIMLEALERSDS
jgi:hypothetical protein